MKCRVLTATSTDYLELDKITGKSKADYALKHGYDYFCDLHLHSEIRRISWERAEIWKRHLKYCDWLFFTGCDAMITNQFIPLEGFISDEVDFIFAADGGGLQSDSWIMRNCQATRDFLDRVAGWEGKCPNEQEAMNLELSGEKILSNFISNFPPRLVNGEPASDSLRTSLQVALNRSPVRCKILPQRWLNSYDMKHYGGTGWEPHSWHKGDFVYHLPAKTLEYRLKVFGELEQRLQNGLI